MMSKHFFFAAMLAAATTAAAAAPPRIAPQSMALNWSSGAYAYDGAGNIVSIGPNWLSATDSYRYDGADRLLDATARTAAHDNHQSFSYDAYGNLRQIDTQQDADGPTEKTAMGVRPATNRINDSAACIAGSTCVFGTYDEAGNQISASNGVTYDFDALGTMAELHAPMARRRFLYNANGERIATIAMTVAGATTGVDYTLRGLDSKVLRTARRAATTWEWKEDYVYRSGKLLGAVLPNAAAEKREHFHLDHLGTPRLITDDRGYKVALHTYLPFGLEAAGSDADAEPMKFTGHERDFGDGPGRDLDYMHARFYGPAMGRFLSVDPKVASASPAAVQSWNRYSYTLMNPLKYIDHDGQDIRISSKADVQAVRDYLKATMAHPSGRADIMAVLNDHSFTLTIGTGSLNSRAQIAADMQFKRKSVIKFGLTTPTNSEVVVGSDGKHHTVVHAATMILDTYAVNQWHDKTGVTTTAHEFHHTMAMKSGGDWAAGDDPDSERGPAEKHGKKVSQEPTDVGKPGGMTDEQILEIIMRDMILEPVQK